MKTKEKQILRVFDSQINECQTRWNDIIPHYQKISDLLMDTGITPTKEILRDVVHFKGRDTLSLIYDVLATQAKNAGVKDEVLLNEIIGDPWKRLAPILSEGERIVYLMKSSFLPIHKMPAFSHNFLTISEGKVTLSDEDFQRIVNEHFTVYLETPAQIKLYEQANKILPDLNTIFDTVTKVKPEAGLHNIFFFDQDTNRIELNEQVLFFLSDEYKNNPH